MRGHVACCRQRRSSRAKEAISPRRFRICSNCPESGVTQRPPSPLWRSESPCWHETPTSHAWFSASFPSRIQHASKRKSLPSCIRIREIPTRHLWTSELFIAVRIGLLVPPAPYLLSAGPLKKTRERSCLPLRQRSRSLRDTPLFFTFLPKGVCS